MQMRQTFGGRCEMDSARQRRLIGYGVRVAEVAGASRLLRATRNVASRKVGVCEL
jgi:hypothetical protein